MKVDVILPTHNGERWVAEAIESVLAQHHTEWHLTVVDDVDKYTLEFLPEGHLQVQADCNSASGTYMVDGSQLFIEITTTTMAECPPESHSDEYIRLLNDAVSYVLEGDHLFISIIIDSGIMKFARGSP